MTKGLFKFTNFYDMKITGTIVRSDDKYYQIISDDEILNHCFGGYGYSIAEAKADFMTSIREAKEMIVEDGYDIPKEAENIEVEFRYDIPSFFNYFDWINISAFAKKAGINESKMRAYKAGVATASEKTLTKIFSTVKAMGAELSAATL